jgi:hypothetical protein
MVSEEPAELPAEALSSDTSALLGVSGPDRAERRRAPAAGGIWASVVLG